MKVTFQDLIDSRIPAAIGACQDATDPRLRAVTNESLERLMYEGHWHNTTVTIRFCAIDGCITQPPQVAAIERFAVCGSPGTIRTMWHEFLPGGFGPRGQNDQTTSSVTVGSPSGACCGAGWLGFNEALPRGFFPSFADITGLNKRVNLVCDLASDVGKQVLVLGYDPNQNWVRTNQGGVILDGELVTLAQGAGTNSINLFSVVTDLQFNQDRDGKVWMYEFNTDTSIKRMIGQYEAFERRPNYARHFLPSIRTGTATNGGCLQTLVDAIVKLNFWPVKSPTDYLCVPCLPALKEMMQAVNDSENEPDGLKKKQLILAGLATAKSILNAQLQHFVGDGAIPSFDVLGSSIGSLDPVPILVGW